MTGIFRQQPICSVKNAKNRTESTLQYITSTEAEFYSVRIFLYLRFQEACDYSLCFLRIRCERETHRSDTASMTVQRALISGVTPVLTWV